MKRSNIHRIFLAVASAFAFSTPVGAQITSNEGDGVLNAPYRGTIDSLRECSAGVGYGEVKSHVEPVIFCSSGNPDPCEITSRTIDIWVEGTWDRSVLRMYEGLDASEAEIDLTSPVTVRTNVDNVKRFSFKAIGTKTLAPQTFTIRMSYFLTGFETTPTRTDPNFPAGLVARWMRASLLKAGKGNTPNMNTPSSVCAGSSRCRLSTESSLRAARATSVRFSCRGC